MAGESSFDVVSDFDRQELKNALDQARREIATRYDFRGATAEIAEDKDELVVRVDGELRLKALRDIVESKAIKRGIDLATHIGGGNALQRRPDLPRHNCRGRAFVILLKGLTNAHDWRQPTGSNRTYLARDNLIGVPEPCAAFGVPDDHIRRTGTRNHANRNLTGMRPMGLEMDVLRTKPEIGPVNDTMN